mgnify:CR=1 FL=1
MHGVNLQQYDEINQPFYTKLNPQELNNILKGNNELTDTIIKRYHYMNKMTRHSHETLEKKIYNKTGDIKKLLSITIFDIFSILINDVESITDEELYITRNYTRIYLDRSVNRFSLINDLHDDITIIRTAIYDSDFDDNMSHCERFFSWNKMCVNFTDPMIGILNNTALNYKQFMKIKKCPKKLAVLTLNDNFNQIVNFLPDTIKHFTIYNKNFDKPIFLPEGITEFCCYSDKDYRVYTKYNISNEDNSKEVANKFPNSLKKLAYGGTQQLVLPYDIEELYYFGKSKFVIHDIKKLLTINIIIHNENQNVIIKRIEPITINILVDKFKDRKCSLSNVKFPERVNNLGILIKDPHKDYMQNFNAHAGQAGINNMNIQQIPKNKTQKNVILPKIINNLYLSNDINTSIINSNIKSLYINKNKSLEKENSYRILDYLSSSLNEIHIDGHEISDNFDIKTSTTVSFNNNEDYKIQDNTLIKIKNLPNNIRVLNFNISNTLSVKIPNKVHHFNTPHYNKLNKLPLKLLNRILKVHLINKYNTINDKITENKEEQILSFNECEQNMKFIHKYLTNISTMNDIYRKGAIDKNKKKELIKENEEYLKPNRIIRDNNFKKIDKEKYEEIINEKFKDIIFKMSANKDYIKKIKFTVESLKK